VSAAVDAIVATVTATAEWSANPVAVIHRYIGWAADAYQRRRDRLVLAAPNDPELHTHVACALVVVADDASITRGTVLDGLVAIYGSGT